MHFHFWHIEASTHWRFVGTSFVHYPLFPSIIFRRKRFCNFQAGALRYDKDGISGITTVVIYSLTKQLACWNNCRWEDPQAWEPNGVPTIADSVVLTAGHGNVTITGDAACKSLA